MEKWRRSERVSVITKCLLENPNKLLSLNYFTNLFQSAKSSISEDISIIRDTFQKFGYGKIETLTGAGGGVMFYPEIKPEDKNEFIKAIAMRLQDPKRILPGGFIYMADIIFDARVAQKVGEIFAQHFMAEAPQYVVTMETKGIPPALMTAKALNVPLVVIRDGSRVTEGTSVSLNYVTGSSKQIRTMTLSRRALPLESRVVIIDDFMKAGGTAKGMVDLLSEFKSHVLGIGVLVDTGFPERKLVSNYCSLLKLLSVDEQNKRIAVEPTGRIFE